MLWEIYHIFQVNIGVLSTVFNNVFLSTFPSLFVDFFFFFSVPQFTVFFLGTMRGREKEQHMCYKMMANGKGSPHHSTINHHTNSPVIGSPKHMGTQSPAVRKEGRG